MERRAYYSPFSTSEHESNPEKIFRASIGFDFIFHQNGTKKSIKCVEINGDETGIYGINKIPATSIDKSLRQIARIRAHHTGEINSSNRRMARIIQLLNGTGADLSELEKEQLKTEGYSLSRAPIFCNAYKNPEFIRMLTITKENHSKAIPDQYKLTLFTPGENYQPESKLWIVKPSRGINGKGILFIKHEDALRHYNEYSYNSYIFQEFIYPSGADKAPPELSGNAASMRYLIDYVCDSGKIIKTFEAAYMRVAPTRTSTNILSEEFKDSYVVNLARKAVPIPGSPEELDMARQAAREILTIINSRNYEYMDAVVSTRKTPVPAY